MYHYRECGLDNVWLGNGYHEHKSAYGEGVSIEDTDGLHKAIGLCLVDCPRLLTGAEFRFLRVEMDLSQRRLGDLFNVDEQAVARWEKARTKPVRGAAERFIRVWYKTYADGSGDIKAMISRLAELDANAARSKVVFRETPNKGWQPDEECA